MSADTLDLARMDDDGWGCAITSTVELSLNPILPAETHREGHDMSTRHAPIEAGGIVRVLCDTTDGRRITADITAGTVDLLKCGCWRVRGARPGPDMGPYTCRSIEVLLRGCGRSHDDGSDVDGTVVPAPIVVRFGPAGQDGKR